MQRERQGRDDAFGNVRGFGMMPSLFGGRDPFDDPFFTRPFGSMFEPTIFKPLNAATSDASNANRAQGVVIEELTSDDEDGGRDDESKSGKNSGSGKEPSVEHPDDDLVEKESGNVNHRNDRNGAETRDPQARNFSFHTCKVTYGGVDGAYYTSTKARRTGTDGVLIEESKEADKTTGQAAHRISRGIHDKGHSVTRKLNSDGKVDTMQTLHNLNEDELAGFEEAWKGNAKGQLPGWTDQFDKRSTTGSGSRAQKGMASSGGWALPFMEQAWNGGGNGSGGRTKNVVRINIE